jgi:ABC-type sugar transport system permease subunit
LPFPAARFRRPETWPSLGGESAPPGARPRSWSTRCTKGVEGFDLGGSSAQAVILILIVTALTLLQFRYIERRVQHQ